MNHAIADRIKVLAFDVFGTVVDWHQSIMREVRSMNLEVDPDKFALAWRAGYVPAMQRVMSGQLGWTPIDDLHRMILDELLDTFRVTHLSEEQKRYLNKAWHRLDAWPDTVAGLTRLSSRFRSLMMSNPVLRSSATVTYGRLFRRQNIFIACLQDESESVPESRDVRNVRT